MGLKFDVKAKPGRLDRLGFVKSECPQPEDMKGKLKSDISIEIGGHRKTRRHLIGQLSGGPALIHVEQYHGERLIGGQSVLVLPATKKSPAKSKKETGRSTAS